MSRMIQVRNVPDWLHEELVRRAKRSQRTLTDYVQSLLEREVARPPADEVFERLRRREPVDLGRPAAELIHEERAEAGRV
ncbi:MAG TPA: antitoxin [Thermoanaerobaculia bacterium]